MRCVKCSWQVLVIALPLMSTIACGRNDAPEPPTVRSEPVLVKMQPSVARNGVEALRYDRDGLDLVFEGGGAKGLAHVGALREMENEKLAYRRIAGTSAGALVAMFVAAGYTSEEIRAIITERMPDGTIVMGSFLVVPEEFEEEIVRNSLAYKTLMDMNFPESINAKSLDIMLKLRAFREAFSLVEFGGLVAGDAYLKWMGTKLEQKKPGLGDATFAEFYEQTGSELTIVAADMDSGNMLILNHRTSPDLPVVWAARMSSSVPFAFRNVRWHQDWGQYLGEDIVGHRIVDGGVASNLPLLLMIADADKMVDVMGAEPDRTRVLGFLLDENGEVPGLDALRVDVELEEKSPIDRHWDQALGSAHRLIDTLMRSQDNFLVSLFPGLVCHLPAKGFTSLQYDMSEAEVDALVLAAQRSTRACIARLEAEVVDSARSGH